MTCILKTCSPRSGLRIILIYHNVWLTWVRKYSFNKLKVNFNVENNVGNNMYNSVLKINCICFYIFQIFLYIQVNFLLTRYFTKRLRVDVFSVDECLTILKITGSMSSYKCINNQHSTQVIFWKSKIYRLLKSSWKKRFLEYIYNNICIHMYIYVYCIKNYKLSQ